MEATVVRVVAACVLAALGFYAGSERVGRLVARLLLYFSIPSVVLYKAAFTGLSLLASYAVLVSASLLASLGSAALAVPRLLKGYPRETVGAAVLAAGVHNSAFLPIPLMLLLYGDAGPAALYSTIINVYVAVLVPVIVGFYSPSARGGAVGRIAASLASYPPLYALAAAVLLRAAITPPHTLAMALEHLYRVGAESTIVSFYLVGSALHQAGLGVDRATAVIAFWRLAVEPSVTLALLGAVEPSLGPLWRAGLVLESFMPPATMNLVVSMVYGLDYRVVARSIGFVTPFSVAAALLVRVAMPPG